jgi:hypothetical protein
MKVYIVFMRTCLFDREEVCGVWFKEDDAKNYIETVSTKYVALSYREFEVK